MSRTTWIASCLSLALLGCVPKIEDGQFTCHVDSDCPGGLACHADGLCYRGAGTDGGALLDAEAGPDAGHPEAGLDAGTDASPDAATGCGPNCIQVIVLNADPTLSGDLQWTDMTGMQRHIGIPPYGQTTPTTDIHDVPVGGTWSVFAPGSLTSPHDLSIPTGSRYVLAIGPSSFGAGLVLLDAPVLGLHTGGYVYLNVIDMVADDFGGLLVSGAGRTDSDRTFRNPVGQTTRAMMLPYLPSQTGAMRIELNGGGGSTGVLVGALLDEAIPATEGTYWMVLAGRLNAHLDGPDGLRFIPGLPSVGAPLRSAPVVRFSNALPNASGVTVCQSTTMIAHVASGALSPPQVPPSGAAWPLEVHVGPDCATGSMQSVSVGTAIGRTLVSIAGNTTTAWAAVSIPEPVPAVGSVQTIVIHNALPSTSDIAGATAIDSLSTSSASFTSLPTVLTATTTLGPKSFAWDLMSRQTWLVVRALSGGTYAAYEIDSPYAANWSIVSVNGS